MIITYNELLNNMQNTYYEKCGEKLDLNSSCGARVQAVASELFSLACYGDFILKQAFVQTATGEYLDKHAQLRDMTRKNATNSIGVLTFSVDEAQKQDLSIPKDTVCCVTDNPYLQYATDEDAVLTAGELSVDVNATAIDKGNDYNTLAGTITTMVNPPSGIVAVTNQQDFTGGFDEEFDMALRNRILSSYSVPPSGFNEQSIADSVLTLDEVLDCKVYVAGSLTTAYIKMQGKTLTTELSDKVKGKMLVAKLANSVPIVYKSNSQSVDVVVEVHTTFGTNDELESQVNYQIENIVSSLRIGDDFKLNRITSAVAGIEGVDYCDITCPNAVDNVVYCNRGRHISINSLKVTYYD